jgi:biofilm PGA synthesis N-glycosyltransferase PgaC
MLLHDGSEARLASNASLTRAKRKLGSDVRELGRNAGLLSVAAAISAVGNLVFLVVLGRSAPNAYGETVGLLVFGATAVHVQSGVQFAVARQTALNAPVRRTLRDGVNASMPWLAVAALLAAASSAIASYLRLSSTIPVVLALAYASALILFGVPAGVLLGRRRFAAFVLLTTIFVALRLLLGTLIGWNSADGRGALAATFVAMAITVMLAFGIALRAGNEDAVVDRAPHRASITGDSSYGALASAGLWACWCLPVLFARHVLPTQSAADFGTAQLVMGGMLFLASPLVWALYPAIVQHGRTKDILLGLVGTLGLGAAGTTAASTLGPPLVRSLYGQTYSIPASEFLCLGLSVTAVAAATYGLWISQALRRLRRAVGLGVISALVVEAGLGALAHSALGLAAGPIFAIAVGAVVAAASAARALGTDDVGASSPAFPLDNAPKIGGLLAVTAVGVMAHNEAASVAQCLRAVLDERDGEAKVPTVVVVVSGSTDGTVDHCLEVAATDSRVRVVVEPERSGKASAENIFLGLTHEPIVALVGGDTLLAAGALTEMVNALAQPTVGMAGGRIVPTNARHGIANRLVHLMWTLHDEVSVRQPKLGEVVAFRRCFERIDVSSLTDEVTIERQVREAGLQLRYVRDAVVYNRGPRTLRDYLRLRARNNRGHVSVRAATGYAPATAQTGNQVRAAARLLTRRPASAPVVALAAVIEVFARAQARTPQKSTAPAMFAPIASAKGRIDLTELAVPTIDAGRATGTCPS